MHTSLSLEFIDVQCRDMFRALLAHPQEALRERRIGDYCVLKLIINSCRTVCIQYILLYYIGLDVSKSENAVGFCTYQL
jgi:hypothetical protein